MNDKTSGHCKCHRKARCCYKTIYHSFPCTPVAFLILLCPDSPASHNSICLCKCCPHTIWEIGYLHSIRTSCNIHSIRIHLVHKTHYKCHCYIIKCCLKCRRKPNLNNLCKYPSWLFTFRTLLCFYKYSPHCRYNNKIHSFWNNCCSSNSHDSPVKHKQEYWIQYNINYITDNCPYQGMFCISKYS